jgi:hypothetical protein
MRSLAAASTALADTGTSVLRTTLLDLVWRLGAEVESEEATVAAVESMLANGRVELSGNFRGVPVERILAAQA